jgi:hypothetical protein
MEAMVVGRGQDQMLELKLYSFVFLLGYLLIIIRPNGATFSVPSQNVQIPSPSIGDVVTFYCESYVRRDVPMNPKVVRIRTDVSWEDVVLNYFKQKKYIGKLRWEGD